MQRLISAVTAFSVALYVVPPFAVTPARAETAALPDGAFSVDLSGQTVICLPDKAMVCPDGSLCVVAKNEANCLKKAERKLGGDTSADAATTDGATTDAATTDAATTDTATADASTETATEAPAAPADPIPVTIGDQTVICLIDKAQSCPDGDTCVRAKDAAHCDKAAQKKLDAMAADAAPAATEETATTEATAPADKTTEAASDGADTATADAATADAAPVDPVTVTIGDQAVLCLPDKTTACPDGSICVRPKNMDNCEKAAQKKLDSMTANSAEDKAAIEAAKKASDDAAKAAEASGQKLIDAPTPTEEAVQSLDAALDAPDAAGTTADDATVPAAAADAPADDKTLPADKAPAADAVVTTEVVTPGDTRSSDQDFEAAPVTTADGKKKSHLSNLEKVGLVALGALVIGDVLAGKKEVVSNTGDRVVVRDPQGNYQVYKDDDTLLRQPGSNVRTETFNDGSTRTTVVRTDGSQIVTIRDASGRVIRRSAYDASGLETTLIDDTVPEQNVDVTHLPKPGSDDARHRYSLRQIRNIPEIKAMAKELKVENVTFDSGSAAIKKGEAQNLSDLGDEVKRLIRKNPDKVFLIEGHTDAVGTAASNLTLSDRRAESVAKALIEYYGVPPENLVVQGYGEGELLIDTNSAERMNRRVVVRDVTPLLKKTR